MKQKNVILMVVAVGCGLVAAVLTARMNAAPAQIEKVSVIVPTKDITVGTMISKEDAKNPKLFTRKEFAKDAIPPGIVESEEDLIDRRIARNYSAGEAIKKEDLKKGAVVTIPPGHQMIAQSFGVPQAVAGFVTPGSRVDILGTVHLGNKYKAFPVLVNMLILAVDTNTQLPKEQGTFPSLSTVSFAVDQKQALVLELAKARGCTMTLLLRNPAEPVTEADTKFNIDDVIKRLSDSRESVDLSTTDLETNRQSTPEIKPEEAPIPAMTVETIKILVASEAIPAGTEITSDLIAEKFVEKEMRKGDVENALDPKEKLGQSLKNGLGKGQWVTEHLVGDPATKASPRDPFVLPKADPDAPDTAPKPLAVEPKPITKKKYHDVTINSASGVVIHRYEEAKPGQWRYLGVVPPNSGSRDTADETPARSID